MSEKRLHMGDLDQNLIVWGIENGANVTATGMGWRGEELMDARLEDPTNGPTGEPVYYHPDDGWTNAATGRPVA